MIRKAFGIALVACIGADVVGAFAPSCHTVNLRKVASAQRSVNGAQPATVAKSRRVQLRSSIVQMKAQSDRTAEQLKGDLMTVLSYGTGLQQAADPKNRIEVNEILLELEPMNPTESPAMSSLMNGGWELVYTGGYAPGLFDSPTREIALLLYTGGYRPGLVANLLSKLPAPLASALSVEDVELKIEESEPRVEASLKVQAVGNEQMIRSKGNLVAESDVRMRETFMKLEAFGQSIELPGPFKYSRNLLVTYLDDDFLIVRDESGVPDIWLRKSKNEVATTAPASTSAATKDPSVDPTYDGPAWEDNRPEDVGPSDY
uniref:Plastid lipid-associated protein/fibrillin conserved domain-containing protein n=1 Tax=Hanusia phi TaxID=3032 RepID=A0A7S0E7M4_9CRYP|mmetsp:Transcript_17791/g.40275  ORF Transcript_17791/g.40275 Transcript_17791/m.40275 type:complete len:317 (+) Transcript_17791:129-1079(+)